MRHFAVILLFAPNSLGEKNKPVQISHLDSNTTGLWKLQEMVAEVLHPVDVDPYI